MQLLICNILDCYRVQFISIRQPHISFHSVIAFEDDELAVGGTFKAIRKAPHTTLLNGTIELAITTGHLLQVHESEMKCFRFIINDCPGNRRQNGASIDRQGR